MSPTNPDPLLEANRHALLEEGARSYLEALTALTIFRQDVRSICRQTIENRLTEFSQALGVPMLDAGSIIPSDTPEEKFNGSSAYLGVKHKISSRRNSVHGLGCISSCGLSWEPVGQKRWFGCWVSVWFNLQDTAELLHAGFGRSKKSLPSGITLGTEGNHVWLARELKPSDMASLSERLSEVMAEWIRLWSELGGLKALTSKQA